MLIVDYSWSHPDPAKIKAAGYVGAMRYLTSKVDAKLLQAAERDALHEQGLAIGLIWQTTADEARTGAAGGVQRALRAEEMADALGYPAESPLFFAVDFDATADLVRPYFAGILDTLTRPAGVYGSHRVVEGLPEIPYVWQCAAWSRGQISDRAHLYQRIGHTSPERSALGTTDENRMYLPLPLWLPGGAVLWINPAEGRISSEWGVRPPPWPSPHLGIDIAAPVGTPIKAAAAGTVVAVNTTAKPKDKVGNGVLPGRTGRAVLIDHGAGIRTYAGHMDTVLVKIGAKVKAGQTVGTVGLTGNTSGAHVHYETHVGGAAVNPRPVLEQRGVTPGRNPYTVAHIKSVQSLLNLVANAGLFVDGDLGPRTIAAVEAYQRTAGLRVDGDPGPITLAALRNAAIPETKPNTENPKPEPPPAPPAPEEDAMPTPQDLWLHPLELPAERRRDGDPTHMPAEAMVGHAVLNARDAYESGLRAEAKADAALAAVQALTLDPAATAAAIGKAVDQALTGLRITREA